MNKKDMLLLNNIVLAAKEATIKVLKEKLTKEQFAKCEPNLVNLGVHLHDALFNEWED